MYYKLIDLLRKDFQVTTIDLLGLGGSGRPKFDLQTSRDCTSFFVYSLEAWMRINDEIQYMRQMNMYQDPVIIMGHGLGAYVAVQYAKTFPKRVD